MPLASPSRLWKVSSLFDGCLLASMILSRTFCPASFAQATSPNPTTFRFVYSRMRTIPFTMHAPSYRNIYAISSGGGKEEQLTDENHSFGAVLSPDGSKIVFIHLKAESCEDCFYPVEYELYVMNADGTDVESVAAIEGPVAISWSPDSKMLAYGEFPSSRNSQVNSLSDSSTEIDILSATESPLYLLRLNNPASKQKLSENAIDPFRWSPDGKWIAFGCIGPLAGKESRSRICLTETGRPTALRMLPERALPGGFSWSSDSVHLAYFGSNRGTYTLLVVGIDGSAPHSLTDLKGLPDSPQWSPDGRQLVYSSIENKKSAIFAINADSSGKIKLTEPKLNASRPMWSPDGKQVLFTAMLHGTPQVHLMNADGSQARTLTRDGKLGCRNVVWLDKSSLALLSCAPPLSSSYGGITHPNFYLFDTNVPLGHPRQLTLDVVGGISFAPIAASRAVAGSASGYSMSRRTLK